MLFDCKYCKEITGHTFSPKFFKNPFYNQPRDPKYLFHIRSTCDVCKRFNKFMPQDEEVMEEVEMMIQEMKKKKKIKNLD